MKTVGIFRRVSSVTRRRVGFRSHDGHAIDFAFHHAPNASRHPLGIVIRVSDDDFLAALHRLIFEAFHQFGKKGLVISEMISPSIRLLPETRVRAWVLG